jgi:hypothetical protein
MCAARTCEGETASGFHALGKGDQQTIAEPTRGPEALAAEISDLRYGVTVRTLNSGKRTKTVNTSDATRNARACARVMGSYWRHRGMTLTSEQTWPSRRKGRLLCGAKTRAGGCCQVRAEPGKARCRFHGGKSTGPKTQALVVRASPRPSACGGDIIERGIGKLVPLRRNAITSDAVTRLWRRLSEAAAAHRPKPTVNEGSVYRNPIRE